MSWFCFIVCCVLIIAWMTIDDQTVIWHCTHYALSVPVTCINKVNRMEVHSYSESTCKFSSEYFVLNSSVFKIIVGWVFVDFWMPELVSPAVTVSSRKKSRLLNNLLDYHVLCHPVIRKCWHSTVCRVVKRWTMREAFNLIVRKVVNINMRTIVGRKFLDQLANLRLLVKDLFRGVN